MARRSRYVFANEEPTHRVRHFFTGLLVTLLLLGIIAFLSSFIMSRQVMYKTETITIQHLPADLENFTILHISDLRGKEFGKDQKGIVEHIGLRAYSCVVFTGDMVGDDGDVEPFLSLIRALPSGITKFLVAGDNDPPLVDPHEHGSLSVYAPWVEEAQKLGVIVLDEPVSMTRGKADIWFIPTELYDLDLDSMETAYRHQLNYLDGLGVALSPDEKAQRRVCEYQLGRIDRIRDFIGTVDKNTIQIAVGHTPLSEWYVTDMIQYTSKDVYFSYRYVSLFLAGHYCNGGWRLPGKGAIYVEGLGRFPADHLISGVNYLNGIPQHISGGLAGPSDARLPGRVFNTPSITMLTLTGYLR